MHRPTPIWRIRTSDGDLERTLSREFSVSRLTARVMQHRGVGNIEQGRRYLRSTLSDLSAASDFPDMPRAVERILRAIDRGETILIFGDYDVDGMSGACLLAYFLGTLEAKIQVHIPERLTDGYGLSASGLAAVREIRPGLMITVDHGVTAVDAVATLQAEGIDVIITDHHQKPDVLPDAFALLNPLLLDDDHSSSRLSGSGVAFKLACGVFEGLASATRKLPRVRQALRDCVMFASLGTVADVVPLIGENRLLVRSGLKMLAETQVPGLRALCDQAQISRRALEAEDISFSLAPRLNAAGRMGQVSLARRLLLTSSLDEARQLAKKLDELNQSRRELENQVLEIALARAAERPDSEPFLVLGDAKFHAGVMGIVAARLVDRFAKPVFMISIDGDSARGSGRSFHGVDLAAALRAVSPVLRSHGGHAAAAGLEMDPARIDELRTKLVAYLDSGADTVQPQTLQIDSEVQLHQMDLRLVREMDQLGPFGEGNPRPLFAARDVELAAEPRRVGQDGNHLLLKLRNRDASVSAIAFGQGHRAEEARDGRLSMVFSPKPSTFRGGTAVEILIRDWNSAV